MAEVTLSCVTLYFTDQASIPSPDCEARFLDFASKQHQPRFAVYADFVCGIFFQIDAKNESSVQQVTGKIKTLLILHRRRGLFTSNLQKQWFSLESRWTSLSIVGRSPCKKIANH